MKRKMVLVLIAALLLAGCIWVPGRGGGVVVAPAPVLLAPPVIVAPGPPGPPGPLGPPGRR